MSICTDMSLVSSLLPNEIIDKIQSAKNENFGADEEYMRRVAKLLANLMKKTSFSLIQKQLEAFDPNPGDHQCQMRGALIFKLTQSNALIEEAKKLNKLSLELQKLVEKRGRKSEPTADFFRRHFELVRVSKEMVFFLRSYLLTIALTNRNQDVNRLNRLADVTRLYYDRDKILNLNANQLSKETLELFREIGPAEPMLSTKTINGKYFSSTFFQMRAVLSFLKMENAVIQVFDELGNAPIYFRASNHGLKPLNEPDENIPFVRFKTKNLEGVRVDNFEETVLSLAAKEPPYDRATSTIHELTPDARNFVLEHRKVESPFEILHVSVGVQK